MKAYKDKKIKTTNNAVIEECVSLIEEKTGFKMYDEQVKAAISMYQDNIVNLTTGGGKTLVILLAALLYLRDNRKVYVISANDYLVKRDYDFAKEIYKDLNKKASVILGPHGGTTAVYETSNIIYASGQTLVFDFLRGVHTDYDVALIDEIDFILVESAAHTFAVSTEDSYVKPMEGVYRFAMGVADILTPIKKENWTKQEDELFNFQYEADVILDMDRQQPYLTKRGYAQIASINEDLYEYKIFIEALLSCLYAKYFLKKNEHYMVKDKEILLIDIDTGRIGYDCHFDICIQTALEIKENIPVQNSFLLKNEISYSVFFTLFKTIVGISGTADCVPYDFGELLGKSVKSQKPHFKVNRKEIYEYFETDEERRERVTELVKKTDEPILLITSSDKKTGEYYEIFKDTPQKKVYFLDNTNLNMEKKLLSSLKEKGTVLISSKIVGRGTDIVPNENSGLVVILAERLKSARAEKQLIGRTGRNGVPGICYILTAKEDELFSYSLKKNYSLDEKNIQSLQRMHEARQYDMRRYLYLRDKAFFDIDKDVTSKLERISSYREMIPYVEDDEVAYKKLEEILSEGYAFLPTYRNIIRSEYCQLKPFFQAQFQTHTDIMAFQFLSDQYFNELADIYIKMGNAFISETIKKFVRKLSTTHD